MTNQSYLELLNELADEAKTNLDLVDKIKWVKPDSETYSDLDAELQASIGHLHVHAGMLEESLTQEVEAEVIV